MFPLRDILLLLRFATQIFSGLGSVVVAQVGGVAFWAHIGGFATGWLVAKFFENLKTGDVEIGEILDS